MNPFLTDLLNNILGEALFALVAGGLGFLFWRYKHKIDTILGSQMTASRDHHKAAFESEGEIYVNSRKGLINITNSPAKDHWPLWSNNSKWLAFMTDRDGDIEIYVADTETRKLWRATYSNDREENFWWNWRTNDLHVQYADREEIITQEKIKRGLYAG